jgi:hypothetical protein
MTDLRWFLIRKYKRRAILVGGPFSARYTTFFSPRQTNYDVLS